MILSIRVLLKSDLVAFFFFFGFVGTNTSTAGINVIDSITDTITPNPAKIPKVFMCMMLLDTRETRETNVVTPAMAIVVSM